MYEITTENPLRIDFALLAQDLVDSDTESLRTVSGGKTCSKKSGNIFDLGKRSLERNATNMNPSIYLVRTMVN